MVNIVTKELKALERDNDAFLNTGFLMVIIKQCGSDHEELLKAYGDIYEYSVQIKLIKEALSLGVDINSVVLKHHFNLSSTLLFDLRDLLFTDDKNHITADNFMKLVIYSRVDADTKYALTKYSLEHGADPNYNAEGKAPLNIVDEPRLVELIKSYGGKCSMTPLDELKEGGADYLLFKPQLIIEQKYKNLNATRADHYKIPLKMFHIWLTHSSSPKELRTQDIANVIETKNLFAKGTEEWEHIVFTNEKSLIPKSTQMLEEAGIQVVSIYEYQELRLLGLIEDLIEKKKWGMASDTLRYSLVEYFGGVYADLNFVFHRDVADEAYKYNFFTMSYDDFYYIDNFFFGASSGHPVIKRVLDLVERNLLNPPSYLSDIKNQDSRTITDMGTANPICLAFYTEANKSGNTDVVYPLVSKERNELEENVRALEEEMRALEEGMHRCPEFEILKPLLKCLQENEICGLEYHLIGHDSKDGMTWL